MKQLTFALLAVAALVQAGAMAPVSEAVVPIPPKIWQVPEDGVAGAGAGRMNTPLGIGVNAATGHIYVADELNARIDEFTAWGEFVKAWGWNVAANGAPGDTLTDELEVCTVCQAGSEGSGAGQMSLPRSVGIDAAGNVYVAEQENHRVQKYDQAGNFLWMVGGEVEKGPLHPGNLCTAANIAEGDECGTGTLGTGNGQFSQPVFQQGTIAVAPDGTLYVGDTDRIQKFAPNGAYEESIALPEAGMTRAIAIDPASGDLYFTFLQNEAEEVPLNPFIYRHHSGSWKKFAQTSFVSGGGGFPVHGFPQVLSADPAGNLYVLSLQKEVGRQNWHEILEFNPAGECLICLQGFGEEATPLAPQPQSVAAAVTCNASGDSIYAPYIGSGKGYLDAWGVLPDPAVCPPPVRPASINDQFATTVNADSAVVRSHINSHFWTTTTYYVEYGTSPCELGGCNTAPSPPGKPLESSADLPVLTGGVLLPNLEPGTKYFYRFVAKTVFGAGEEAEVKGVGGEVGNDGTEGTFTTPAVVLGLKRDCGNQAFRTRASAYLPDCRAYEMVSPLDKNGGDAIQLGEKGRLNSLNQSATNGNGFTFSSDRAFGDVVGAPNMGQYLADREANGWSTRGISAPQGVRLIAIGGGSEETDFKAFSPDLCTAWAWHITNNVLATGAISGFPNLYRRENCGAAAGTYASVTELQGAISEPNTHPADFLPELQGMSADSRCAVFRAPGKLTEDGSDEVTNIGIYQLYENCDGNLRLVSILPDGLASDQHSSAGTASGGIIQNGRDQSLWQAVSSDGSTIYWTADSSYFQSVGKIYVRVNATEPQSALGGGGECLEPTNACTYAVSETVSSGGAVFRAASPDGTKALFTLDGTLYEFEFNGGASTSNPIAGEVAGILGASTDLSRIYFVSKEQLAAGAVGGGANLYLDEEGSLRLVTILSSSDADQPSSSSLPSPIHTRPDRRVSRVSPNGEVAVFMSNSQALSQSVAGLDNTDANSGEADAEVYIYEAGPEELRCISCNPTGVRPSGEDISPTQPYWAAARIQPWQTQLFAPHVLSDDGSKVFFESFEGLVPRDSNEKQDVYEWERATSAEECTEFGAELFVPSAGGCISLISSGESSQPSQFLDSTGNGSDVFIGTAASLLPQDYGLIDVYDAREGGGFPAVEGPKAPCQGESCQSPPPAPEAVMPSSSTYEEPPPGRSVAKHKHRHKKHKHRHKKHGHKRGGKP